MATTKTSRLDTLRRKLAEAKANEREVQAMPGQLRAEAERLAEALLEHDLPVDGSPPPRGTPARKAWDAWEAATVKLDGPWAARFDRARTKRAQVEAEFAAFVNEHLGDLLAEVEPDTYAARDAVVERVSDLATAIAEWHEVSERVSSLLGPVPGINGRDIPSPPFEQLRIELRSLSRDEIPAPLPRTFYPDREEVSAE